ncbi:MAG: amidohydrolase family protein [Gemmatimonadota bacterium]|nr:amidohydrolase family protein [Gemmatimonadota bacterium]
MHKLTVLAALALSFPLSAQNPPTPPPPNPPSGNTPPVTSAAVPAKWDVMAKHGTSKDVNYDVSEGTWMNLDVSPDGKWIVFDLVGDIYKMPNAGGTATLILGGAAYEMQPRFSPDGKRIAFASDRDGLTNVWTSDLNGKDLRQVSKEKEREVSNPAWTPDGQYLVNRKHFRNTRSLGAGEMWLYHVAGGNGLKLTDRRNWEQNATEPIVSNDGRYVYFTEDVSPGGGFQYNRDAHGQVYVVQRFDRQTGNRITFIGGAGSALRPQLSPDGKTMSFVRRVGLKSVLWTRDLESGRERPLWDGLDHDQQEAWAIYGTYPGYDWTPDGKSIVIWAGGKINSVDVASGRATNIPFSAHIRQTITDVVRTQQAVAPDSFNVKMLRWVTVSPDQRRVVYTSLGKLYVKDLPNGTPRRVTNDSQNFEVFPSWSPDGRTLVYATWDDDALGAIRSVGLDGRNGRRITAKPGHYIEPRFSSNGSQIVYSRIGGDARRSQLYTQDRGIYIVAAGGGEPRLVTEDGSTPRFNRAGDRIFLIGQEPQRAAPGGQETQKAALISVNLTGGDRRVHLISDNATEFVPSPDEKFVAWLERFNAYVAPLPLTGKGIDVSTTVADFPAKRISRDAGIYLHWSPDSRRVYWALGPELFQRDISATFAFETEDTTTVRKDPESKGIPIGFKAAADRPSGRIALTGATVITMKGTEVIPNATILVDRNRITYVGSGANIQIPADTKRIDVTGKYIMPGFVDAHAHVNTGSNGITPRNNWAFLASLAFGTTTMHDPSNETSMVFSTSETARAGGILGPRLFSTGTILYGAEGNFKAITTSFDEALTHLRRMQAVGAFSVKSYNQPRRDARQQIVEAARQLGMEVVPEGGSTFSVNTTMFLDGHTTLEHNLPVAPLYEDMLRLISESKTAYTPTLVVLYGGVSGEHYWYQNTNVRENAKLQYFHPRGQIDSRARRRQMAASDDYFFVDVARAAKALTDRGVTVATGAHGQLAGMAQHWETWMMAMGGMTNHEAIRAGTLNGAKAVGLDRDIGSLESGKLADLIVLDADPLANIRNTQTIRYVMVNGRIFDALTMAQIGNHPAAAPKPTWRE